MCSPDVTPIPKGFKLCRSEAECLHPGGPVLPLGEFYRYQRGYSSHCRICTRAKQNTPEYKAYQRAYGQTPERKAKRRAYREEPQNKTHLKEIRKAYRQTDKYKAYRKAHEDERRREANLRKPEIIKPLYKQQKGCCWWCGSELLGIYHVDHRVPVSRGGTDDLGNLCLACPKCNGEKSNKLHFKGRLL